jgi:hypothetical protein
MNIPARFTRSTRAEDCVGKTIEDAHHGFGEFGFRFADGTYIWARGGSDEYDDIPSLEWDHSKPSACDAYDLGLLNDEEFEAAKAQEAEREATRERKQYERLKAKFEGREGEKADDPGS